MPDGLSPLPVLSIPAKPRPLSDWYPSRGVATARGLPVAGSSGIGVEIALRPGAGPVARTVLAICGAIGELYEKPGFVLWGIPVGGKLLQPAGLLLDRPGVEFESGRFSAMSRVLVG
jgi:hypothetical protein